MGLGDVLNAAVSLLRGRSSGLPQCVPVLCAGSCEPGTGVVQNCEAELSRRRADAACHVSCT